MRPGTVAHLRTHPVKGEPGVDHEQVEVEPEGLAGDRRKGAAVHVVAARDADGIRANVVVDLDEGDQLPGAGTHLAVGEVELAVTGPAKNCPGVYADVVRPGVVRAGDPVVALAGEE